MGIDRKKWKAEFREDDQPRWPCPSCGQATLRFTPETLKGSQTKASKEWQEHEASEPDQIEGRFGCIINCANCGNSIGAAGTYRVQDDRHWDERHGETGDYRTYYHLKYFTDSPHLVEIPESTPDAVRDELLASFQLFWSDPFACTNRIRSSVEKLLTSAKIPKKPARRRGFLSLHDRIERYRRKQPEIAERLMAVKWIGNAGSHANPITGDDAIDGYVLMDWVLNDLYARRHREARVLARKINQRKRPRSHSRAAPLDATPGSE